MSGCDKFFLCLAPAMENSDIGRRRASFSSVKKGVEHAVVDAGFESWTVLRRSLFMANFLEPKINNPMYGEVQDRGTMDASLDSEGIAKLAVAAFQDLDKFHGRAIGVASELLAAEEIMKQLGAAVGKPLGAVFMTDDEIAVQDVNAQVWVRFMSDYVDVKELGTVIRLTAFEEFLERERATVKATYL
ncbi:hypothetical protein F4776DRAFT_666002 [Hypoxylon sp. NC0597]|nr:hypothetical protein F4776DRAFT_666002 [Hypoxylon sp. NC0597]